MLSIFVTCICVSLSGALAYKAAGLANVARRDKVAAARFAAALVFTGPALMSGGASVIFALL